MLQGGDLAGPGLSEIQSGNGRQKVDGTGWNSKGELGAQRGKILLGNINQGNAKQTEGLHPFPGISGGGFDSKINILGVAALGMMNDRVAARHQIADITGV
jgi:hypothetical protein